MSARLDHLTLTPGEFAVSLAFYEAALGALGWVRTQELGDEEEDDAELEVVGFGPADGDVVLWLVTGAQPSRGVHLAVAADSPEAVQRFHGAAVAAGGRSHDAPRRWAIIRRGRFNAIVADPDGNLVEAVAPE